MLPALVPALLTGGASIISSLIQGDAQRQAARRQRRAQERQFGPFIEAGQRALREQQILMGLHGEGAQRDAIAAIEGGPQMAALLQQGENAMLQNAAATGGLRGGNLQGALAQFRPQLLNQLIDQRMNQLSGLSSLALQGMGSPLIDRSGEVDALATGGMLAGIPAGFMAGLGRFEAAGGFDGLSGLSFPAPTPPAPIWGF